MYKNIRITISYIKIMSNYRNLTQAEIEVLENNVCWAEDWQRVMVAEGFRPYNFHRVIFYGDIRLGSFEKMVEVSKGFVKHSGINDATLRNVTVGNDCLIEKVGNYINNYTIVTTVTSRTSVRWRPPMTPPMVRVRSSPSSMRWVMAM